MVSSGLGFVMQLFCLFLCRDLERLTNFLSLLLPFFQAKLSFCHCASSPQVFCFFFCSGWSVTDIAKGSPLSSIKYLYTHRSGQNFAFGSIDFVICSSTCTTLFSYFCCKVCLESGPFLLCIFVSEYELKCSWIFIFSQKA